MFIFKQDKITSYFKKTTSSSVLAVYRIGFGLIMLYSILRFWNKGWIKSIYLEPKFHFKYYGFEWVQALGEWTYALFFLSIIFCLFITIGFKYKFSIIGFFLTFTYIELIDKTTYLNHYYFISILSFLLVFLPANAKFSIDNLLRKKSYTHIPLWTIDVIKLLLIIVYLFAGIAKINSDWLLNAMPLSIWLKSKYDIFILGDLLQKAWVHYLFSWGGMLYDITIPFLLLWKRTRFIAFCFVVIFHALTAILFPIGMFPYIMIFSSIIFFNSNFHDKIISIIKRPLIKGNIYLNIINHKLDEKKLVFKMYNEKIIIFIISIFFIIQILIPFRYMLYDGELFWTEQGYRFSWRVMLIEKMGYTTFTITDNNSNKKIVVNNQDFLTPLQEKQMSFQPDFILEYAHFLGDYYKSKGFSKPVVTAESYVTLNGRPSQEFIDNKINLYLQNESFKNKSWILPLNDEIKGF